MGNIIKETYPDYSEQDGGAIHQYMGNGKPGWTNIKEEQLINWLSLYMDGKTFEEKQNNNWTTHLA